MAAQSVHFWGRDNVINAYKALEIPAWSLWQGSQMLPFRYEGTDIEGGAAALLRLFNSMSSSTNALYTLKVYEALPKTGKIARSTEDSGSFNFRLNMDEQILNQQQLQSVVSRKDLESEIAALKQRIDELEEEEDLIEDEGPDMFEKISGLLEKPAVVGALNKLFGFRNTIPGPGTISGIPQDETIAQAIAILKEKDPRLSEHLAKLAKIATEQPHNFNFLLSTLDTLQ